jgi:hypothetical protein
VLTRRVARNMDVQEFTKGLSVNDAQDLLAHLIRAAGEDAVYQRALDVPQAVGPLAMQVTEVRIDYPDAQPERSIPPPTGLVEYLDPETELSLAEQMDTMSEFWGAVGYTIPELDAEQNAKLESVITTSPDKRILPTPLMSLEERKAAAEKARTFTDHQFGDDYQALWAPTDIWTYGKLLRDPEGIVGDGFAMRYRTTDGSLVGRGSYIDGLLAAGQAVQAEDGTVWTFPVMDVRVHSERAGATAGALYDEVDPIATPESLIALNILHQANGTPNGSWEPDFSNEATYEVEPSGEVKALSRPVSVVWDAGNQRIGLYSWKVERQSTHFGRRPTVSGL